MVYPFKTLAGQISAYLTGVAGAAYLIVAGAPRNWAVQIPSVTHSYGIRFDGGGDLFFRPAVGWYIEHGLWVCFAMMIVTLVIDVVVRALTRSDI